MRTEMENIYNDLNNQVLTEKGKFYKAVEDVNIWKYIELEVSGFDLKNMELILTSGGPSVWINLKNYTINGTTMDTSIKYHLDKKVVEEFKSYFFSIVNI